MVLKEGGYNRYREQGATNLGELAGLVLDKYGMFFSLYLISLLLGHYYGILGFYLDHFINIIYSGANDAQMEISTTSTKPQTAVPKKSEP